MFVGKVFGVHGSPTMAPWGILGHHPESEERDLLPNAAHKACSGSSSSMCVYGYTDTNIVGNMMVDSSHS